MEYNNESNVRKREKMVILLILILMIFMIIIFLLIRYFGYIDHKERIPTGNVDIFDIIFGKNENNCNCGCCCGNSSNSTCEYCNSNGCNCNKDSGMTLPLTGDETSQNNTGSGNKGKFNVVVYDDEKLFSNNAKLNIFTNTSYYVVEDKIAPTSENTYQFVIRNNNEFNIQYDFEAVETNEKNINMKYRLKRNGKYVLGNDNEYISVNELKQYNINLASKSYDVYTLEWKWFESSNDTEIGMDVTSKYSLFLKLSAIQY